MAGSEALGPAQSPDSLKYRQAIERASVTPDPNEAVRLLDQFAGAEQAGAARTRLRPTASRYQKLLAGVLARAGSLEEASLVLGAADCQPVGPADALIVDPALASIGGHHYHSDVYFRRLIEDRGSPHPSFAPDRTGQQSPAT